MLEYSVNQAPKEKMKLKQCITNNLEIPNKIKNAPQLLPGLDLFFNAFCELNMFRNISDGKTLNWNSVDGYCKNMSIEGDQRDRFFKYIHEMDKKYMKMVCKDGET